MRFICQVLTSSASLIDTGSSNDVLYSISSSPTSYLSTLYLAIKSAARRLAGGLSVLYAVSDDQTPSSPHVISRIPGYRNHVGIPYQIKMSYSYFRLYVSNDTPSVLPESSSSYKSINANATT
eukprot:scaffold2663_cov122-Skeletonema_menzelii.AAC.2